MAKIKNTSAYDVVDHVFTTAKKKKIMHLSSQEEIFNGEFLKINDQELINFGTCGYLGLEKHPHVLAKSHELLDRYGSHFSISRAFVKAPYLEELENLVSKIFDNHPVIVYTSTSVTHQSIIGTIVGPNDLIILDQQVHYSVQYPCQFARLQGTMVKMIRHNNMEMLEDFIKRGYNQYDKIWYMADGVYSMYGDLPYKKELRYLLEKYPKFNLYFDDAHGVGWTGKNGCGSIFEHFKDSERVVLISTLAKGFGSIGGIAVFNDVEMHRKIDIYGGVLSYTHPLSAANVGAAIGAAEIFLSEKGAVYQNELKDLMYYLNTKLEEFNLPNTSSPETPIYFIGTGGVKVTHNLIQKVIADGLYVNTATYPVVPSDKTGLRFTLTRHNTKTHIDQLVHSIEKNFHLAVAEENEDLSKIYKSFQLPFRGKIVEKEQQNEGVSVEIYKSIDEVNVQLWDNLFKNNGNYSHNGLRCIEAIFSNNEKKEENWDFYYLIIKDVKGEVVLATYFTSAIYKDDMLALENVSRQIEKQREEEPYYLCSKTLAMGSLFTEGTHLYINQDHFLVEKALNQFFIEIEKLKKLTQSVVVVLRDFHPDFQFHERFENEGFTKVDMPNTNIIKNPKWETTNDLMGLIKSKKKRDNIKQYAIRHVDVFDIKIKNQITDEEATQYFDLFLNVKKGNYAFNFFQYPEKMPKILSRHEEWEFIEISLKENSQVVAVIFGYIGDNHYCPMVVGLDYNYIDTHHVYKQAMFQMVKRGNDLNKEITYLGLTADFEKQKYLALTVPVWAYLKVDETYNLELIDSYSNV